MLSLYEALRFIKCSDIAANATEAPIRIALMDCPDRRMFVGESRPHEPVFMPILVGISTEPKGAEWLSFRIEYATQPVFLFVIVEETNRVSVRVGKKLRQEQLFRLWSEFIPREKLVSGAFVLANQHARRKSRIGGPVDGLRNNFSFVRE